MPTREEVVEAVSRCGSKRAAARELGVNPKTIRWHLDAAERWGARGAIEVEEASTVPDGVPVESLIKQRMEAFEAKRQKEKQLSFRRLDVKIDGPVGILHMGDPHVDDDGTDLELLFKHTELTRKTEGLFAANIGDVTNNWIGSLTRLWANQATNKEQAREIAKAFLESADWLYLVGGNHDCHDSNTEALTQRGWLNWNDITYKDKVLSLNTDTGKAEWSGIIDIKHFYHDGEMVNIECQGLSACITKNHRVLRKKKDGSFTYTDAEKVVGRLDIPVCGLVSNPEYAISDEQIRLAGWILTDGYITRDGNFARIGICQSKEGHDIPELLDALGLEYNHSIRNRDISEICGKKLLKKPLPQQEWRLNAESSRRVLEWLPFKHELPEWAHALSSRQFDLLLDAIIAGDGVWDGKSPEKKNCGVVHKSKQFLDSLQSVAVQHGWNARISVAREKDYRLNLFRRESLLMEPSKVMSRTQYKGTVWCLRVEHGNFMVRRNGAAHFSGNSWTQGDGVLDWFTRQHGYMKSGQFQYHGVRMGLRFPSGFECRINSRHDFKGSSEHHNGTHGGVKEARFHYRDHIYISGHRHFSAHEVVCHTDPLDGDGEIGRISHVIKVGSYKRFDEYAKQIGAHNTNFMPACLTIIDPYAVKESEKIHVYYSPEQGAEFLTWLRNRR